MIHAREDYNRIQDPLDIIPKEEPVFLLRAQDVCASATVRAWARFAEEVHADPEIIRFAREQAFKMEAWQEQHVRQIPDLPEKSTND